MSHVEAQMLTHSADWRIGRSRWLQAQKYEQGFWQRLGDGIEAGTREQLDWYAGEPAGSTSGSPPLANPAARPGKVLEIGSGPIGIVNFLEWGERYAIDPLEHFYRTQPSLAALRKPGVTYLDGAGERLPFDDGSFSLVIIDNVIDHTYAPRAILEEIRRVLAPDGRLYLSVNVHTAWGAWLHGVLAALADRQRSSLHVHQPVPCGRSSRPMPSRFVSEHVDRLRSRPGGRQTGARPQAEVKGFTGLSEFSHSVLCRLEVARP